MQRMPGRIRLPSRLDGMLTGVRATGHAMHLLVKGSGQSDIELLETTTQTQHRHVLINASAHQFER